MALPLAAAEPIRIVVDTARPLHSFDPTAALGATIDAHDEGENQQIFTKPNVDAIRSAGFHRTSYRLMTELAGEAWHWNPAGSWSDAQNRQGYWTSSSTLSARSRSRTGIAFRGAATPGTRRMTTATRASTTVSCRASGRAIPISTTTSPASRGRSGCWSTSDRHFRSTPCASPGGRRSPSTIACSTGPATMRSTCRNTRGGSIFREAPSQTAAGER